MPENLPNTEEGIRMKFHAMRMLFKQIIAIGDSLPDELTYETYEKMMNGEDDGI